MASNPFPGMGGFFPGMLGDLLKLLQTDAPFPFELAEQLASTVAAEGDDNANPEPAERMRLEGLLPIAELHVADVTGMSASPSGRPISVVALNRLEWARRFLRSDRALFERLGACLKPPVQPPTSDVAEVDDTEGEDAQVAAFFSKWAGAIAPAMVAMQFGSIAGHLARRTLGQYFLPIPRESDDELAIVTANLASFAADWSIPVDDLSLAVLVRDVATHTVFSRPHVRERLTDLLVQHAGGLQPSPAALEERFGEASGTDLSDIGSIMGLLGDPASLGELVDTPELREVRADLAALGAVISGYVEWVTETVGTRAISTNGVIREAFRRARTTVPGEDRGGDPLFGELTEQSAIDRGEAFVRGVLERGGEESLAKLWVSAANLPTAREVDDPGQWLERINLESLLGPDDEAGDDSTPND